MRVVATIFSWIEGALRCIVFLIVALFVQKIDLAYVIAYAILVFIVLVVRQVLANKGKTLVPGIITILVASFLGGIFTLCIPSNDNRRYQSYYDDEDDSSDDYDDSSEEDEEEPDEDEEYDEEDEDDYDDDFDDEEDEIDDAEAMRSRVRGR